VALFAGNDGKQLMTTILNLRAQSLATRAGLPDGVEESLTKNGARILDFGIDAPGGLQAGEFLTGLCMSLHGGVSVQQGSLDGASWPQVVVQSDRPVEACLLSQYAGWKISVGDYFAMGSGPMRAAAASEELFEKLDYRESPGVVVGILETGTLPDADVVSDIADKCGVASDSVTLAVAPTSSIAGTFQVVARSVETSMHKLFELGFDVKRIRHGYGSAPLPPVAADDLTGIGLTNDAILYGGEVTLWVSGDDDSIAEVVQKVPSSSAECYGQPFLDIFREADHDFYKIDPMLFSPAAVTIQNLDTGRVHRAGQVNHDVLKKSFGI
jgi:methenyltetrahydromethanopterin cyclohydrolase